MKKPRNSGFIRLDHDLVRSDIWTGLSANAKVLLIGIWDQYNGHNNGELRYGYSHAERLLGCSTATAKRTFAELKKSRLIICTEKGSFAHKDLTRDGKASAWRITAIKPNQKTNGKLPDGGPRSSFHGVPGDP